VFAVNMFAVEETGIGEPWRQRSASRRGAKVAKSKFAERIDPQLAGEASTLVLSISDVQPTQAPRPPRAPAAVLLLTDRAQWTAANH
jgi:hypothetical protein